MTNLSGITGNQAPSNSPPPAELPSAGLPVPNPAIAKTRVALVVGNSDYRNVRPPIKLDTYAIGRSIEDYSCPQYVRKRVVGWRYRRPLQPRCERLLTGWSLVRIRPGEPHFHISYCGGLRFAESVFATYTNIGMGVSGPQPRDSPGRRNAARRRRKAGS